MTGIKLPPPVAPGQPGSGDFLVEARNASDQVSRIQGYHVVLAGSGSGQQPGKPCTIPANSR
jgi:hypothetical protein